MNSGDCAHRIGAAFSATRQAFRGQRSAARRAADTIRLPPSTVRASSTVPVSSTDDTLANTTLTA